MKQYYQKELKMDYQKNLQLDPTSDSNVIYTHKYTTYEPKQYCTEEMPLSPVDPVEFAKVVSTYLQKFGNIIHNDASKQLETFCRLYNYNIQLNQTNNQIRLIHAAQTGTAKSLSLQIYTSMLKTESSLIVVSKVDEAIAYCKFINELRQDENYAKCFYTITDKNKNYVHRVENYELKDIQCIVISHAMFQRLNQSDSIDMYRLYKNNQRDLIVVDEKINLYLKNIVSLNEIKNLKEIISKLAESMSVECFETNRIDLMISELEFFSKVLLEAQEEDRITNNKDKLNLLVNGYFYLEGDHDYIKCKQGIKILPKDFDLVNFIKKDMYDPNFKHNFSEDEIDNIEDQYIKNLDTIYKKNIDQELAKISELVNQKIESIMSEIALLSKVSSAKFTNSISKDVKDLLERIKVISTTKSYKIFSYADNFDSYYFTVDNIINQLGSCVILDATANVNEFYKIAYYSNPNIQSTEVTRSRQYNNLTIFKAKGFSQGRSSIYNNRSKEQIKHDITMYLSHASNILSNPEDKMLIITHKGFKKFLLEQCNDSRISFTHWGDHVGKNNWSDCNFVMVIGWNYINRLESICNGINALNNIEDAQWELSEAIIQRLIKTQLVDDLVQGVMRSQARKIDTIEGDCKKTDIFLYHSDRKEDNEILDLFIEQFPKAKVVDWEPIGLAPMIKKTKPNNNVDRIILHLENLESKGIIDVFLKDVLNDLEINKSTASRLINKNEYFDQQLDIKGYKLKNSDGKSKYFILK